MRRALLLSALLGSWAVTSGAAQQPRPFRVGAHVAGNTMNGPFDFVRVGGQLLIPLDQRLYGYPSVSRFLDGARWEVTATLRYRPFGLPDADSPFYIGAGWAGVDFGPNTRFYDLWLSGVEIPAGRLRPYLEIQLLGPVHRLVNSRADYGVQIYSGITWAVMK